MIISLCYLPSTEVSRYRDMRGGQLGVHSPIVRAPEAGIGSAGRCRDGWRSTVPG